MRTYQVGTSKFEVYDTQHIHVAYVHAHKIADQTLLIRRR